MDARWAHGEDISARVPAIVQRDQLVSWMNNKRWRDLTHRLDSTYSFRFRCVCLEGDPKDDELWAFWDDHNWPPSWQAVEWLDLDVVSLDEPRGSRAQRITDLKALLRSLSIRFTTEGRYIRIWGYTRPGATPQFE